MLLDYLPLCQVTKAPDFIPYSVFAEYLFTQEQLFDINHVHQVVFCVALADI